MHVKEIMTHPELKKGSRSDEYAEDGEEKDFKNSIKLIKPMEAIKMVEGRNIVLSTIK